MRWHGAILLCVITCPAGADLYAVSSSEYFSRRVYRASTVDATTTLLSEVDQYCLYDMKLGPDGRYYGVSDAAFERVVPSTGDREALWGFGDPPTAGGLAVAPDGVAWFSHTGYLGAGLFAYDVVADDFVEDLGLSQDVGLRALFYRADGVLLASEVGTEDEVFAVNLETGAVTPAGVFEGVGKIFSFATDPATEQAYMLAGDYSAGATLYAVDMYTFERVEVGAFPAGMGIEGIAGIGCEADFNADGGLNVLDFLALQSAWQAGQPSADVNGDGSLNVLDFVAFQAAFLKGCG